MNTQSTDNVRSNNPNSNEETTMQCDQVWDLLSVYADGEASAEEAGIVQSHVAACSSCAADLEFMQSTSTVVQSAPAIEPPAMLRDAILAATVGRVTVADRLAAAVRRTLNPMPVRYGALAAAGAAALVALTLNEDPTLAPNPAAYKPTAAGVASAPGTAVTGVAALPIPNIATVPAQPQAGRMARVVTRQASRKVRMPLTVASRPAQVQPVTAAVRKPAGPMVVARNPVNFREKVSGPARPFNDLTPEDMPSQPTLEPENIDEPEPTHTTLVASSGGTDGGPVRIQLAASSAPVSGGQASTLADLKRALNREAPGFARGDYRRGGRDREIHVDVIRSSF